MNGANDYQPPLTRWGHTWRTLLVIALSGVVAADTFSQFGSDEVVRVLLDLALGGVAFTLAQLRRRQPLTVALATLALSAVSASAAGPAALASVSLATRRVTWQLIVVAVVNVASATVFFAIMPRRSNEPWWISLLFTVVAVAAALAWGMYIGSRRELLGTLRQRAERAEAERDLRTGKARSDERARIAREMHDVLAHRISQIAMHAGALAYRDDLDAAQLRAGIADVQARANAALTDLRGVLGVLRDPDTALPVNRPQPTHDDLPELVDQAREAGARIDLDDRLAGTAVPPALGRTLYRLVQEGITNAHKHAAGTLLTVRIDGDAERGVEVVLSNPIGLGPPAAPGAGFGLIGLTERVELAGGRLSHGREGTGTSAAFVVRGWLPWTP